MSNERSSRTWADIILLMPRYIIILCLVVVLLMILRAEFSSGKTQYGFLGVWGKDVTPSPSADDAIIGANARLNRQLQCGREHIDEVPTKINDWKEFMEVTAETKSNDSLRKSRTVIWKKEVDDVLRQIRAAQKCLSES